MRQIASLLLASSLLLLGAQGMPAEDPPRNYTKLYPIEVGRPKAGTYGVDVSSHVSVSEFKCLKDNGFNFAIVRAYQSTGKLLARETKLLAL